MTKLFPRKYVKFFWPLSLMGIAMQAGKLAQSYVLLGFDEGVRELAWFALALAAFCPFQSALWMAPQMVTVNGTDRASQRLCLRFLMMVCAMLAVPLVVVSFTPLGTVVVPLLYNVSDEGAKAILLYLRLLTPILFVMGFRQWAGGVMVREKKTGWFTGLKVTDLMTTLCALAIGIAMDLPPVWAISCSWICAELFGCAVTLFLMRKLSIREDSAERLSYSSLFRFFWPLAITTFLFTLSRPLIFSFVTKFPTGKYDKDTVVAGMTLAFNLSLIFQCTANQYRHLMTRFGKVDPAGLRQFMISLTTVMTALLILIQVTPAAQFFFERLQRAEGDALKLAMETMWVLIPVTAVISFRNYFHGLALVHRRTGSMAVAGVMRNAAIVVFGVIFVWLNGGVTHVTGGLLLVFAFSSEATTVFLATRSWVSQVTGVKAIVEAC